MAKYNIMCRIGYREQATVAFDQPLTACLLVLLPQPENVPLRVHA